MAKKNDISRIATNLRKMDSTMKKSVMRDRKVYQALGYESAAFLRRVIKEKTANLEWGKGKQTDYGKVSFTTHQNASSVRLRWTGEKVSFVEYGTGIYAVANPYPGDALVNYQSQSNWRAAKTGKNPQGNWSGWTNEAWFFDSGDAALAGEDSGMSYDTGTRGWAPIAPFYTAMLTMQSRNVKQLGYTNYQKAVKQAVTNGWFTIMDVPN